MMSIQMVGGVYCPLSHRDPQHRLYGLIEQTKSHLVLVHHVTKALFTDDIVLLDINSLLINKGLQTDINARGLSKLLVTSNNITYIIFTSGSTGIPKPVSNKMEIIIKRLICFSHQQVPIRHKNFTQSIRSLVHIDIFNENDTILQMGRCSFDIHVQETMGTLMNGATVVMLRPRGNIDFDYLSAILLQKQITFIYTVPSLLQSIFSYLEETKKTDVVKYLRSVCTGGK
jgi:non-ribosomal peptide synthetase component F